MSRNIGENNNQRELERKFWGLRVNGARTANDFLFTKGLYRYLDLFLLTLCTVCLRRKNQFLIAKFYKSPYELNLFIKKGRLSFRVQTRNTDCERFGPTITWNLSRDKDISLFQVHYRFYIMKKT